MVDDGGAQREHVQCGFIKAKFDVPDSKDLSESRAYEYASLLKEPRVTMNYIYLQLGHQDLPDNETARDILTSILALKGRVTRLDFHVDYSAPFAFDAFYALHNNGKPPTPSILKSPQGTTVYIGKRASAFVLRVYDKRKEILAKQEVDIGFALTRIEIECKRKQVARVLRMFMERNTIGILQLIQENYGLRGFCARSKVNIEPLPKTPKVNPMGLVYRYRRAIRQAYLQSPTEFYDTIGVEQNGVIW